MYIPHTYIYTYVYIYEAADLPGFQFIGVVHSPSAPESREFAIYTLLKHSGTRVNNVNAIYWVAHPQKTKEIICCKNYYIIYCWDDDYYYPYVSYVWVDDVSICRVQNLWFLLFFSFFFTN